MNHHTLREIAKVGVGLAVADLASVFWFSSAGLLPLTLLGVTWTAQAVWPIAVFDIAIIVLLVHYGWRMKLPITSPTERGLLKVVGAVFLIVALLHLSRIAFGWTIFFGGVSIPLWLSWCGVFIPAYLSYSSFHFSFRR